MAGAKDVTIRAQALDSTWQVIGGDAARGLYPANVTLEADAWGSSRASFNLRRDPRAFFPDIGAFTPVEIDVASTPVWSGRVSDTPSRVAQRVMNVQCEGWQYHLDDDLYRRAYVHTNLGEYNDMRSVGSLPLGTLGLLQAGQVSTGGGITLGAPNGMIFPVGTTRIGVLLDLGQGNTATRMVVDWESSNNTAVFTLVGGTSNTTDLSVTSDAINFALNAGASGTSFGTSTAGRYVYLVLAYSAGAATATTDVWIRIKACRLFADTAYESGNQSVLKASTVVSDALTRATSLLSTDRSGIDTTTFSLPSYAPGYQTARQTWTAVDAYHDWLKKIDVNRRPIYTAKPARPIFEVGAHSDIDDDDASANSGAEIYNRGVATGQSPDGQALGATRASGEAPGTPLAAVTGNEQIPNGFFETDVSGWSYRAVGAGDTMVRDTTIYDSPPASLKLPKGGSASGSLMVKHVLSGTFRANVTYRITLALRTALNTPGPQTFALWFGDIIDTYPTANGPAYITPGAGGRGFTVTTIPSGTWITRSVTWTPDIDVTSPWLHIQWGFTAPVLSTDALNVDSVTLARSAATLVDRRGFRRSMQLPINTPLPSDLVAANLILDTWLSGHRTTPFRGSVTLAADESLREITTGRDVGLEQLLLNTGQLIRFSDRADPDTGGHGRDGRIAAVTYQPATNTAAITIDNSRTNFDALLSRLAIIQGG